MNARHGVYRLLSLLMVAYAACARAASASSRAGRQCQRGSSCFRRSAGASRRPGGIEHPEDQTRSHHHKHDHCNPHASRNPWLLRLCFHRFAPFLLLGNYASTGVLCRSRGKNAGVLVA